MRAELEALRTLVETLGRDAFLGSAPASTPAPYYLIELASGRRPDDLSLSGETAEWDLTVRVKAVGRTFEQALTHLDAARTVLTPLGAVGDLTVADRGVWVRFVRHEADYTDRDVTPNLFVSLDAYTLTSVPA